MTVEEGFLKVVGVEVVVVVTVVVVVVGSTEGRGGEYTTFVSKQPLDGSVY